MVSPALREGVRRGAAALALGLLVCAGSLAAPGRAQARPRADAPDAGPSALVWRDEFTGAAGARPDGSRWTYNTGGGTNGWGNQELQWYTSSAASAALDGLGRLALTARATDPATAPTCWYGRCRYTSARLMTIDRMHLTYGRLEVRASLPAGAGLWPAVWALDVNQLRLAADPAYAEIDLMEHVGSEPDAVYASLHARRGTGTGSGPLVSRCTQRLARPGAPYENAFRVYAVDWTPERITFSVDGVPFVTRSRSAFGASWTFDQSMFVVVNLAVGGVWAGSPPAATRFPATLLVDYVRVYAVPADGIAPTPPRPPTHAGGCDGA